MEKAAKRWGKRNDFGGRSHQATILPGIRPLTSNPKEERYDKL
jgi:hypothetical protein